MSRFWRDLSNEEKKEIVRRWHDSEDVDRLALEYNLKSSSLSRRLRELREIRKREIEVKETLVGDVNPGSNPNERTLHLEISQPVNTIVYSDLHAPFEDKQAVAAFLRCVKSLKHDIIIDAGDGADMYSLSKYTKNQLMLYKNHVQKDFEGSHSFCERLNKVSSAKKYRILGNHFMRYVNWLNANPGVALVDELQLDNLLKSKEYGWSVPVGSIYFNADQDSLDYPDPELVVHHGTMARKHSGSSSRGEAENLGYVSSISGHVHRLSAAYKRTIRGQILTAEAGTLRNLHPDYNTFPDWQHGFLYLTFVPDVGTFCSPVLIVDGIAYMDGKEV